MDTIRLGGKIISKKAITGFEPLNLYIEHDEDGVHEHVLSFKVLAGVVIHHEIRLSIHKTKIRKDWFFGLTRTVKVPYNIKKYRKKCKNILVFRNESDDNTMCKFFEKYNKVKKLVNK